MGFGKVSVLLSEGKTDAKSLVVGVLSEGVPLTAKQVHSHIAAGRGASALTYPAVHKALRQLVASGVVERVGSLHKLSLSWISKSRKFLEAAEAKHLSPDRVSLLDIKPNSTVTIEFNESWVSPFYWLLDEMLAYARARKVKAVSYIGMDGVWPVVVVGREQYLKIKALMKASQTRIVCNSNTFIDKLILSFWKERFGTPYATGAVFTKDVDQVVVDDLVIQIINPKEINDWWKKSLVSKVLDLQALYKTAFESKTKVRLVITRNALLANQLRDQFGRHFKNGGKARG